ncbi:MAG: Gfo/Idh/MocA family oxidoreductase [Clostridia bacterium]|nr:Gfo/Idh/MocA family oxidoreductase [Clostridia bacterium]
MKKFRAAVIGCGVISKNHISALLNNPNTELVAVCDLDPARASAAAEKAGCRFYTDYAEMIEKEELDSVHICLPHYLHSKAAIYAMEHGLWALTEKPMDAFLPQAHKMAEVSEATGMRLGVIFQNRFNPGSVFARDLIRSGKAGKVLSLNGTVCWHRDEPYYAQRWRADYATAGGGVLINQAIHTLDLIRWLSDSEVASVRASAFHHGETTAEVEDTAEGVIKFENGATGLFWFTINDSVDRNVTVSVKCENCDIELVHDAAIARFRDGSVLESGSDNRPSVSAKSCYGNSHDIQIAEFYSDPDGSLVREGVRQALKTQALLADIFDSAAKTNPVIPEMR